MTWRSCLRSGAVLLCPAGIAAGMSWTAPAASSPLASTANPIGEPPAAETLPESRCAPLHFSPHVVTVGQTITGTADSAGPEACGGNIFHQPPTWEWTGAVWGEALHGCGKSETTCTFKALEPTGSPGDRFTSGCIEGSSVQGGWNSCDYYAVLPKCQGNPTLTLRHARDHGQTVIEFRGRDWDTKDCGAVDLSAQVLTQAQPIAVFDTSDFQDRITLRGHRVCGIELIAQQEPDRVRRASYTKGSPAPILVVWASSGSLPGGEALEAGDVLCRDDITSAEYAAATSGRFGPQDASAVAATLGQQLVELSVQYQAGKDFWTASPDGAVDAHGFIGGNTLPAKLAEYGLASNPAAIPLGGEASEPTLVGPNYAHGSYTVSGNLNLDDGLVYVEGDLNVSGAITGVGTVIATGSVTAHGATLSSVESSAPAILAGGNVGLLP